MRNEIVVQMQQEALRRAIRTERWKYCMFDTDSKSQDRHSIKYAAPRTCDLYRDPHEHVTLAGRSAFRRVAGELRDRLIGRMIEIGESKPAVTPARFRA
ncbi:MAG: hypothetical protein IT160_17260 [Bryobacterales bacterium]|nr:hypothetical protein [Bryobacterales bacterium]